VDQRAEIKKAIKHDGLEKFLLDQEIKKKSIDISKSETAQAEKEEYKFYYDDTGKTAENVQIPVTQIKGVSRISGYSWFKLIEYSVLGVPPAIPLWSFNLNQIKFLDLLSLLEKNDLKTVHQVYQKATSFRFACYEKNGTKEYYGLSDGNHRTITAKVYGLHELKARTVYYYVFNDAKYQEFQLYQEHKKEAELLLASLGLFVDDSGFIVFQDQGSYIRVARFPFEDLKKGHNPVSEMIQEMDQVKIILQRVYKKADLYQKLYQHYPPKIRKLAYYLAENNDNYPETKGFKNKLAKLVALKRLRE